MHLWYLVKTEFTVFSTAVLRRHGFVAWWYSCRCYLYTVKIKFSLDKCDESVTSQTTISVNVAFDRIWTLAASVDHGTKQKDFACILRCCCHAGGKLTVYHMHFPLHQSLTDSNFRFWNASKLPSRSAHCIDTTASPWCLNFLARWNTRYKQSFVTSQFRSHNMIFIEINVKRCFYFKWSAYY